MEKIKDIVEYLVETHSTSNPYELAKCLKILVSAESLPDDVRGVYKNLLGQQFIIINSSLSKESQTIALCQKLGLAVLHPNLLSASMLDVRQVHKTNEEQEANYFALYLLSYSSINKLEDYEGSLSQQDCADDIHNLLVKFSLRDS
ncbi:ImmA/IrrE family metallo-endopeptidase [Selenomonadales bacterium OttesenSCG-928-I06]|nr:ImmA/IrrE family metallo-endopeptidase [Selenomonadales bacterium OttesenSCG-928-I06]